MSLVHDEVLPLVTLKGCIADVYAFVSSQTHIELPFFQLVLDDVLTDLHLWVKVNHPEERSPFSELFEPVRDSRLRSDNQMRPLDLLVLKHVREYRD